LVFFVQLRIAPQNPKTPKPDLFILNNFKRNHVLRIHLQIYHCWR